jgi:hypothetical protein
MIIGLCGKRGSGKNLVAEYCCKTNPSKWYSYSFAEPIKVICENVFDLTWDQREGKLKHAVDTRYGKTPRKIFQEIGDSLRAIDKNIFIDALKRKLSKGYHTTIPDVRFANEAEWIQSEGGILVFVNRKIERNLDTDQHVSECELDNWPVSSYDYVIKNPTPRDKNGLLEETKKMLLHFGLV